MKYSIRNNWVYSLELILNRPVILLPYFILAFFELLSLELLYFSTRKPLINVAGPLIKKLFGEAYIHYPGSIFILPKMFFFMRVTLYIFLAVFLSAITVNIVKNIKANLPLKTKALIKNALNQYLSFVGYGILVILSVFALRFLDTSFVSRAINLADRYLPGIKATAGPGLRLFTMFFINVGITTFLISTVPIMVTRQKALLRAIGESIYLGFRNFFVIFPLIAVPSFLYLPVLLLKTFPSQLAEKTSPGIIPLVIVLGIVFSLFIECFILVCISSFILDTRKKGTKK